MISVSYVSLDDTIGRPSALIRCCCDMLNLKEATKDIYNFSFATDKLHVGHFGLANTILAFGDNDADLLIPQVVVHVSRIFLLFSRYCVFSVCALFPRHPSHTDKNETSPK